MLALPAIAAAEYPAPTLSCPADHRRDGHAQNLEAPNLRSSEQGTGGAARMPAWHRTFPPYILARVRALGAAPTLQTSHGLHAKSNLLAHLPQLHRAVAIICEYMA
jgi:hypothetical protein